MATVKLRKQAVAKTAVKKIVVMRRKSEEMSDAEYEQMTSLVTKFISDYSRKHDDKWRMANINLLSLRLKGQELAKTFDLRDGLGARLVVTNDNVMSVLTEYKDKPVPIPSPTKEGKEGNDTSHASNNTSAKRRVTVKRRVEST